MRYSLSLITAAALGVALGSCLPVREGSAPNLAGQSVSLTLLHTSDIHSRLIPYDFNPLKTDVDLGLIPEAGPFGGATRIAAILKRERERSGRTLHLDSGDSFQGAPIFNVNFGEVEFKFLSRAKLDAAVIGNHEFDSGGLNFANQARDYASFPLLAANYSWEDPRLPESHKAAYYSQPYSIHMVDGVKVGVIGMANLSSLNSLVEGGNSLQITPLEQNEAARGYVELLRPVVDLIVVVSHLGLVEDQELVQGYEAYFEYAKVKGFLEREASPWKILQWFGPEGEDSSVVQVQIPGISGIDVILGGHLHVVLNPPQSITDPSGRRVVIAHSGAFAKYVGRLDLRLRMPPEGGAPEMAEVESHDFRVFPVDALWCNDAMRAFYRNQFWAEGEFGKDPRVQAAMAECTQKEDLETTQLLQPYILNMDFSLSLSTIFSYAPRDIARRSTSVSGDSPLGNIAADSMRKRRRVEAEVALTNTLGIRDNLYAGPLSQESMFNVFPFENTINIMYLSGVELQEMLDIVAQRSASRGCQSQAQVSGARFTMDCPQAQLNDLRYACDATRQGADNGTDCPQQNRDGRPPWKCIADAASSGRCWANPAVDITINGRPLDLNGQYKVAVNDYIAKGGSGFTVLKRNTTRIETGISLRDSLIGYMQSFCTCDDYAAGRRDEEGNVIGKNGQLCGVLLNGKWTLDDQVTGFCNMSGQFRDALEGPVAGAPDGCSCKSLFRNDASKCGTVDPAWVKACATTLPPGPKVGRCTCRDALAGNTALCGHITPQTRLFCENPTAISVVVGSEDGRIGRRVK